MMKERTNTGDFILLISGISDNDRLVKHVVNSNRPIYYKSRYVLPYEEFNELRKLLLLVRSVDDVNAERIIAVDLGEWVGHEQDEYLSVMLKYFHDQRDHWRYVFTVGAHTYEEITRLYIKLKTYMNGEIFEDNTFKSREGLETHLTKRNKMTKGAAKVLSELFFSRELKDARSYELLSSVREDLERMSGGKRITVATVKEYMAEEDSLLCLLLGKTVEIKEDNYEEY